MIPVGPVAQAWVPRDAHRVRGFGAQRAREGALSWCCEAVLVFLLIVAALGNYKKGRMSSVIPQRVSLNLPDEPRQGFMRPIQQVAGSVADLPPQRGLFVAFLGYERTRPDALSVYKDLDLAQLLAGFC